MFLVLAFSLSSGYWGYSPTHTKHMLEHLIEIVTGTHTLTLGFIESPHSMQIVEMSLFVIVENLVGSAYGLEFDLRGRTILFSYFIRMA